MLFERDNYNEMKQWNEYNKKVNLLYCNKLKLTKKTYIVNISY
jgi:hypothetical protein